MLKPRPEAQLPGMLSRAQRRQLPVKQRLATVEEFVAALLPLVLHLADQLETALGRPLLRDVFPNRERYETKKEKPCPTPTTGGDSRSPTPEPPTSGPGAATAAPLSRKEP